MGSILDVDYPSNGVNFARRSTAKSLGTDLETLLAIATPIVKGYSPSAANYMVTVQAMIPLVEALAGVTASPYAAPVQSPELIRARIYQGV